MCMVSRKMVLINLFFRAACSCLENPRDGGAWWSAIYGVAQGRTRLKQLGGSSSSSSSGDADIANRLMDTVWEGEWDELRQ